MSLSAQRPISKHSQQECDQLLSADGLDLLSNAIYGYFEEIESCRSMCNKHNKTAAIHTRGKTLQVFRIFKTDELTAKNIRHATEQLPSWEQSLFWESNQQTFQKTLKEIESRMARHGKQHAIITRGIEWNDVPLIVHAYKFEPDSVMKVELVFPPCKNCIPSLPLQAVTTMLECHEFIVPDFIASPLPPYSRHEMNFLTTIKEYLLQEMPKDLYATSCL